MEVRTDIFVNRYLWLDYGEDFNIKYNCPPGSSVLIPKEFDWIHLRGKMDGITLVSNGSTGKTIKLGDSGQGAVITNSKIISTVPYGIKISDPMNFGLDFHYVGDIEVSGVDVNGSYMGIHMGTKPELKYPLSYQNIKLHDNIMQNTRLEAFYIGQDQLGGPFITGDIRNNKVLNAGNDGIQCRNGSFTIEDNDIDGTGMISGSQTLDHAHGILNGGNTNNCIIRRNKLRNVKGFGVFDNGYGTSLITDNDIECQISGVFTKNFEYPGEDLQKVGFQKFIVGDNRIIAANGKRIDAYYRENGCPVEFITYGNTGPGNDIYMPGIKVNVNPVPPTKEVAEKFYRVVSGHRKYYTLYNDGTWELKK